jgi:predicted aminopeptidase
VKSAVMIYLEKYSVSFVLGNKQRILVCILSLAMLSGCSSLDYYLQAIDGHLDVTSREQPIEALLKDKNQDEKLKAQLEVAVQAREFASSELKLPDNDSYRSYADLERPYVVWSVVATPEFSIQPKQWCFLIVGCLSYRGYFDEQEARQKASELKAQGFDVSVNGTTAYSTLGYFDDPLLNTMLRRGEASMIGLMFHELAHQLVHIDGDTAFNEAFATIMEQEGLRRWFLAKNQTSKFAAYMQREQHRSEVFKLLAQVRAELDALYGQKMSDDAKRKQKYKLFAELRRGYFVWQESSGYHGFDGWMKKNLNNSHLALVATYHDLVPNFQALLESVNGDLERFYQRVQEIGAQEPGERLAILTSYAFDRTTER